MKPIMTMRMLLALSASLAALAVPAGARPAGGSALATAGTAALPLMLQCVPYAREVSGIRIYGDAHTWWDQAEGRYRRGFEPKVGAVMAFKPYGKMELGHVAAVSRIVDSRKVLLRHANWSPIDGERGQIEDDVEAVDVSPDNDWSEVRVWFAPSQGLGATHWPVEGFIYPEKPGRRTQLASRDDRPAKASAAIRWSAYPGDPIGAIIASSLK